MLVAAGKCAAVKFPKQPVLQGFMRSDSEGKETKLPARSRFMYSLSTFIIFTCYTFENRNWFVVKVACGKETTIQPQL